MRQNRNYQQYNENVYQKEDNRYYKGVQLPPIDNKKQRASQNQNQREEQVAVPEPDKYERMRNRSRDNAERLNKLREIKSQYTRKNGGDMPARRGRGITNQINQLVGREEQGNGRQNKQGQKYSDKQLAQQDNNYDFEIYEMERVGESNAANSNRKAQANLSTEDEIEALERELAQLKMDIREQENSIARIDEIKKLAVGTDSQSQVDKNQVFGQRVKGKELYDYWNETDQKTIFKVQQVPGGQSQVQIGDSYNFFKDKENSNYINAKLGRKSPLIAQQLMQKQYPTVAEEVEAEYASAPVNGRNEGGNFKRPHPNEQVYNIINHNGDEKMNQRQQQLKQQEVYSNMLRDQIANNASFNTKAAKNHSTINIFEGYPSQNQNKQDRSSPFIHNLYHQQDIERKNHSIAYYNSKSTDITPDGRKNVRVSQPPGGISQVTFF